MKYKSTVVRIIDLFLCILPTTRRKYPTHIFKSVFWSISLDKYMPLQDFGNWGRSGRAHLYLTALTAATRTVWF